MQTVKQPVRLRGRDLNTEEQNCSSFQMNHDLYNSISFASEGSVSAKCHLIKKNVT